MRGARVYLICSTSSSKPSSHIDLNGPQQHLWLSIGTSSYATGRLICKYLIFTHHWGSGVYIELQIFQCLISMRSRENIPQPLVSMCCFVLKEWPQPTCAILFLSVCLCLSGFVLAFILCTRPTFRKLSQLHCSFVEFSLSMFARSNKKITPSLNLSFHTSTYIQHISHSRLWLDIIITDCI